MILLMQLQFWFRPHREKPKYVTCTLGKDKSGAKLENIIYLAFDFEFQGFSLGRSDPEQNSQYALWAFVHFCV